MSFWLKIVWTRFMHFKFFNTIFFHLYANTFITNSLWTIQAHQQIQTTISKYLTAFYLHYRFAFQLERTRSGNHLYSIKLTFSLTNIYSTQIEYVYWDVESFICSFLNSSAKLSLCKQFHRRRHVYTYRSSSEKKKF